MPFVKAGRLRCVAATPILSVRRFLQELAGWNRNETAGPHPGRFFVPAAESSARGASRREALEGGLDETRKGLEVVAALEHGGDLRRELGAAGGHVPEPVGGHGHAGQRIVHVSIEPGRDDEQARDRTTSPPARRSCETPRRTPRPLNRPRGGCSPSWGHRFRGLPSRGRTATRGERRRGSSRRRGRWLPCRCRGARPSRRSRRGRCRARPGHAGRR